MLRLIIAFFAGVLAAVAVNFGFERINARRFPFPPGLDRAEHRNMERYVQSLPHSAFLTTLAGWAVASFACGLVIRLISRTDTQTPAYLAGLLLMTAGIVEIFTIPQPLWFTIVGVLLFIPFTLLGHMAGKSRRPAK